MGIAKLTFFLMISGFFGPDSIRPFNKINVEKDLKAKKFKTKDLEMAVREALDPSMMEQDEEDEGEEDDNDNDEEPPEEKTPQAKKKANKATATGKGSKKATVGRTSKATTPSASSTSSSSPSSSTISSSSPKKLKVAKSEGDADTLLVNNKRIADEDETLDKKKRVSRVKRRDNPMQVETYSRVFSSQTSASQCLWKPRISNQMERTSRMHHHHHP